MPKLNRTLEMLCFGLGSLLLLLGFTQLCSGQGSLSVGNVPGFIGATVSVPLGLVKATNVVAAQFDLSFDPTRATPGAFGLSPRLTNHVLRSREVAPGVFRVLLYSPVNAGIRATNRSSFASVPFTLAPQERIGSGPLTPANVTVAKDDGTAVAPLSSAAGSIFIAPVHQAESGEVDVFFPAQADEMYVIQASTNLVNWVTIGTNLATSSFMDFVDLDGAIYPFRFYRSIPFDQLASGHLDTVVLLAGGQLDFKLTGLEGRTYTLQASTNLVQWVDLSTKSATSGTLHFTNQIDPSYPTRFYRLKSQ